MRNTVYFMLAGALASTAAQADLPRIFMTTTQGNGNLSSWADARGLSGLQAADAICRSEATRANLDDAAEYIAYLSDNTSDFYCRVHGRSGKRSAKCGQAALPVGAGPWYRMDDLPALDRAEWAFPATPAAGYMPRNVLFDASGAVVPATNDSNGTAFTATRADGALSHFAPTCSNWTSSSSGQYSELVSAYHAFGDFAPYARTCDYAARLVCLKRGAHGGKLPRKHAPSTRMAFVSSLKGNAYFASWPAAGGTAGVEGADKVCQQLAQSSLLPLPQSYKAMLNTGLPQGAIGRFAHDGPWYRTDGVVLATSNADLLGAALAAPLQLDEKLRPTPIFAHEVWTGSTAYNAPVSDNCNDWTQGAGNETSARIGANSVAGSNWSGDSFGSMCTGSSAAIYCFGDNDSLFKDSFN
jgi:hypothetical protein